MMGVDMIDTTYEIVSRSLLIQNPGISKRELTALIFKRYYRNDFPPEVVEAIMLQIRNYKVVD